jgi:cytochrome P450
MRASLNLIDQLIDVIAFGPVRRSGDRRTLDGLRMSARTAQKTPRLSGLRVTTETFRQGLSVEGPVIRALKERDIVRFRFAGRTQFFLGHPDYVDHVLHDAASRYHKSVEYELLRSVVGLSLFTDEDESWRHHRMLLNPVLAKRHLEGLCELMINPIEAFMERFDDGSDELELNMSRAMTELTLDVVGSALFGRGMADLAREIGRSVTGGLRAAERAARLILLTNPPWWLARASASFVHRAPVLPPGLRRIQSIMRTVDDTVWDVIHDRQANPGDADDLLGLLLSVRDDDGNPLPLRRVRDEATTFILAGHETTANALSWMWYLLARNPSARERMLEEVDGVLGRRRPTVADIPRLRWTTACFQEAMRLFPPAWIIGRTAVAQDAIDGHAIPRGASVLIPIHAIHHDERFWPEPNRFDPTRFLGENARSHHRCAYLPFGGGRRICIGMSFALMEGTLVTAIMSQRFVYDVAPGTPIEPEATLTLRPRHGLPMTARRRPESTAAAAA